MSTQIIWNVDPVFAHLGPFTIRYYGLCFGLALLTGFAVWYRRARHFGESRAFAEEFLYYGIPAIIIGGRLGFVFFYTPKVFIAHPWRVFAIWNGGLASHGVAAGLFVALVLFSRKHRVSWVRLGDYLSPAAALAVGWIRVGNFFNSEVYGRPASVPWAIVFAQHDNVPRHPAQLYDLLLGPIAWLVMHLVERRNIRPVGSGLISGTFLTVYFGLRMFVEPFKDFYVEQVRTMSPFRQIESFAGFPIHTGQWLSVIPLIFGLVLVARALRSGVQATIPSPAERM